MAQVTLEIIIAAPIEICFDAARNIGHHSKTVWPHTKERAVAGRTSGLIEEGETVTFEARHFGIRQRLTAKVSEMKKPFYFSDEMQKGAFRHMVHRHEFAEAAGGTLVRDILDFSSPYGWVGKIFDKCILERYMKAFLRYRQKTLKKLIETSEK